jgi:hypothetical protein
MMGRVDRDEGLGKAATGNSGIAPAAADCRSGTFAPLLPACIRPLRAPSGGRTGRCAG